MSSVVRRWRGDSHRPQLVLLACGGARRWFLSRKSIEERLPSNILTDPVPESKTKETTGLTGTFGEAASHAVRGMVGPQGLAEGRESTAVPIYGRATIEGTRYTVNRSTVFENWHTVCPPPVGWHISKLGCATCKMQHDHVEATEALQLQIIKGCNMFEIDSNSSDLFQGISRAFHDALEAFELERSGFVVTLRVGILRQHYYAPEGTELIASNTAPQRQRILPIFERFKASSIPGMQLRSGFRFDQMDNEQLSRLGMRRVSTNSVAVLSPDWIDAQLTNLTHQAKLETIDVLWIEGLHTLYDGRPAEEIDAEITSLFAHVEQHVKHGNIQYYGVSSPLLAPHVPRNYPPLPPDANLPEIFRNRKPPQERINLYRLVECARRAGGENHHLRFLQYPFNLTQHQAYSTPLPYDSNHTVVTLAKALGLTTVGCNPIETTDMMHQPQRYHQFPMETDLKTTRMNFFSVAERVVLKEMEVKEGIEKGPKSLPPLEHLFLGSVYLGLQRQITNLFFFLEWLNYTTVPHFRKAILLLKESSSNDMKDWCVHYEQLTNDMFRLRRRLFEHKHGKRSVNINIAIDQASPTLARCPLLSQKAINFATHGCDVVCCGFHIARYFHEATELNPAKNGELPVPEEEIRRLCETEAVSFANVSPPDPYMLEPMLAQEGKFSKQKSRIADNVLVLDPKNPKFPDIPDELEDGVPSGHGNRNLP